MGFRGYLKRLVTGIRRDPTKIPLGIRLELNYILRRLNQYFFRMRGHPNGYRLMEEDWDTAIILDSCRYDFFTDQNTFSNGELRKITSPGSESREFMRKSFSGQKLHDTVYVTGNPYTTILSPDTFHAVSLDDAWVSDNSIAQPSKITEAAIQAHEEYPYKRIIVHYMQPHLPILAPDKKHVNDAVIYWRGQYWPIKVSKEELREAYRANLNYVLQYVKELIENINGRVVITADHGELLGERMRPIPIQGYNHFPSLYIPELIHVPWFEIDSRNRREIRTDPPVEEFSVDEKTKEQRLKALGYI